MADNTIALQTQTPSFTATLGNLLNIKQQQLGLQQGQQTLESQDIALQSARQANQERKNWIGLVQQDPSLHPREDGTFDTGPDTTAKIMGAMPQTGAAKLQELAKSNSDIYSARKSLQGLNQGAADVFGRATASMTGKDPSEQAGIAQSIIKQFPETKPYWDSLFDTITRAKGNADQIAPGNPQAQDAAISHVLDTFSRMPLDVKTQQEMNTPGALNVGGSIINPKPGVPGFPVGSKVADTTLSPGEKSNVIIAPGSNQPVTVTKTPAGAVANVSPTQIGGGSASITPPAPPLSKSPAPSTGVMPIRAAPLFPTPQDSATATAAQQRWQAVREQDSNPQSGYNATKQVYSNLVPLVAKAKVGPGAAQFNQLTGRVATALGIPANTPYQEVSAYLDRLASQTSQSTGAATNFAREQAASATGTGEMNSDALAEKLRFGASVNEASHAYATASQAFAAKHGPSAVYNANTFDSAWTQNADPLAFRLRAAKANGDTEDYQATLKRIKDLSLPKQHAVFQHYQNLSTLEAGDVPK